MRRCSVLLIVGALVVLAGCQRPEVVGEMSQRQANDVAAVLYDVGVTPTIVRGKGSRPTYAVHVPRAQFSEALRVVTERGLPREFPLSFEELIAQRGILPGSRALERLRLDRALSRQIEEALLADPEVKAAQVIVRMSYPEDLDRPTASVVLTRAAGVSASHLGAEVIVERISHLLPSLNDADILVSIVSESVTHAATETPYVAGPDSKEYAHFLFGIRVFQEDRARLMSFVLGALAVCCAFGLLLGYWFGFLAGGRDAPAEESFSVEREPLPRIESSVVAAPRLERKRPTTITEV